MGEETESKMVHRQLETDVDRPAFQIVETIAEFEETEPTELPALYECVDGMLTNLFSTPPAPEAQMQLEFSYHTYRIIIDQDGYMKVIMKE